uniref:[histone H3]-trimethyl-L-lysine(9) demethylase n=1 Tax=Denticeps clupeoides TaxID=299321 RepID=A0AAY4AFW0_9TELE
SGGSPPRNPACKIMTFRPSMEEFRDFNQYLVHMESQGAHRAGLAKVIPPKGWKPRRSYDDIDDLMIQAPIQQMVAGQSGLYTQYNIQKKPLTVQEFRRLANSDKFCTPRYLNYEDLERKYWKNLTFVSPIYGADVSGTLYNEDVEEWNIGHLNSILDVIEEDCGVSIQGVNTPYLYFGMWKTSFSWHTEDMDLYSINYLHFGEPKSWYAVPPEHGKRLERLAVGFFPNSYKGCEAFLRHKMTLISPSILKKYGIPFDKITQEAGEFMITFPYGYHAGFNHGFNCAESTNFASVRWIDYGKVAKQCNCSKDMVKISMDPFVRRFQPDRYQAWLQGKDPCPIDHTLATPSSTPELQTWLQSHVRSTSGANRYLCTSPHKELDSTFKKGTHTPMDLCSDNLSDNLRTDPHTHTTASVSPDAYPESSAQTLSKVDSSVCSTGNGSPVHPSSTELSPNPPIEEQQGSVHVKALLNRDCDNDAPSNIAHRSCDLTPCTAPAGSATEMPLLTPEPLEYSSAVMKRSTKSWRLPLRKPTARAAPSAVKQQNVSDEETPETEGEETESWARPLVHLWHNKGYAFSAEREYNATAAQRPPYCAICTLFMPYYQNRKGEDPAQGTGGVLRSRPLIPEICFAFREGSCPPTAVLEEDGYSPLVRCAHCFVQVHTSCYGIASSDVSKDWSCDRCLSGEMAMECCLCNLHGGALKRTTDNRWAHVMCAIALPEVKFVDEAKRSPIDISAIPLQRYKLKCIYCRKRVKRVSGTCVQCSCGRCSTSFHVTCAHAAGVAMEADDWPYVVFITCHRHQSRNSNTRCVLHKDLELGQTVITKHKNLRYYSCRVTSITSHTFYEVMFDDGSFSNDTYPEDIVSRDCSVVGPPEVGEVVQVKWPDGLYYTAKYLGSNITHMYQVEFEDGSQVVAKREDIYTMDEDLPKKVKGRLVSVLCSIVSFSQIEISATWRPSHQFKLTVPQTITEQFQCDRVYCHCY